MLTSPVLRYELLTLGRRRRYFLLRGVYVLGLLFALWVCYREAFGRHAYDGPSLLAAYSHLAEQLFFAFTCIQLGAILLLTPAMVAGTIAGEHERRTIDYLLTTHLTDGEITLCKFGARMLSLVYQLLVGLPVLALVMLFGGIEPLTLVKVFGYSALLLLGTASLSLWISASCRSTRVAITSTYLAVIVLGGAPLAFVAALEIFRHVYQGPLYEFAVAWNLWSPVFLILGSFEGSVQPHHIAWHAPQYIVPIYLTASAAWLGLAVRALRRTHARTGVKGRPWFLWSRKEKPPRQVGRWAMLWKEATCRRGVLRLAWVGRAATIVMYATAYVFLGLAIYYTMEDELWYSGYGYHAYDRDPFGYRNAYRHTSLHKTSIVLNAIVGTFALLLIAARAGGSATSEKEQDSWLTLLSTPLSAAEIVLAKIFGAIYSVRYWYLFLLIVWLCGAVRFPYQFAWLPVMFAVHLLLGWLCAAVGVFCSLKFKTSLWSIGVTVVLLAIVMGAAPLLAVYFLDGSHYDSRSELYAVGFIAPVTLIGPELLFVSQLCRAEGMRREDAYIMWSVGGALVCYGVSAMALTFDMIRRFADLTGRRENSDDSYSDDAMTATTTGSETATEAAT